jgi:hypothetical protein
MAQQKGRDTKASQRRDAVTVDLPALAGLSGRMRVDVKDVPVATIHLEKGRMWASDPEAEAEAVAVVEERSDFEKILAGELNPVVASIQGRLRFRGDPELATRLVNALNAARPFAGRREGKA